MRGIRQALFLGVVGNSGGDLVAKGQAKREGASLAGGACHTDGATVHLGNMFYDGKAQARAAEIAAPRTVNPVESFE